MANWAGNWRGGQGLGIETKDKGSSEMEDGEEEMGREK